MRDAMSRTPEEQRAAHEAADWLVRLQGPAIATETLDAFYAWRRTPANQAAFARLERLWDQSGTLADDADIAVALEDVLTRRGEGSRVAGTSPLTRRMALAAGLAVAVGSAAGVWLWPRRYATAVGEQRLIRLEDGTRIHINTDSRLDVAYAGERRRINLERGEAWFDVAHDPARPFIVATDDAQVRALGTSFSVRRLDDGARVILAEGQVEVRAGAATRRLVPGQSVETGDGQIGSPQSADLARAMAWREGRLSFADTPLAVAIAEVDRYTTKPVTLAAADYGTVRINGVFETGDVVAFVTAVTTLFPLDAVAGEDGAIVLRRKA
jgi:transmembrane sensor